VHALQDKFLLAPLLWTALHTAPSTIEDTFDMKRAVHDQVDAMGVDDFFDYLAKLMKTNPPRIDDGPTRTH